MKFFTIEPKQVKLGNISFEFPWVKPSGSNYIDIVNNFQWKNNITKEGVKEVPSLILTEYTLPYGKWLQNLVALFRNSIDLLKNEKNDPYGNLYTGSDTDCFKYNLPYLIKPGDTLRGNIKNTWTEVDFKSIPVIGSFLSQVEQFAEIAVSGYGFERVMGYGGTSKKRITVTFPLYNTVSLEKTVDNFWFITLFGLQNLKIRTTYLTYIPPKLYKVESWGYGGVFMPAAYVSGYNVDSIGATREIDIGDGYKTLIPEAYKVSITFEELVSDSVNIMRGSFDFKNKVQLIENLKLNATEIAEIATNPVGEVLGTITGNF